MVWTLILYMDQAIAAGKSTSKRSREREGYRREIHLCPPVNLKHMFFPKIVKSMGIEWWSLLPVNERASELWPKTWCNRATFTLPFPTYLNSCTYVFLVGSTQPPTAHLSSPFPCTCSFPAAHFSLSLYIYVGKFPSPLHFPLCSTASFNHSICTTLSYKEVGKRVVWKWWVSGVSGARRFFLLLLLAS